MIRSLSVVFPSEETAEIMVAAAEKANPGWARSFTKASNNITINPDDSVVVRLSPVEEDPNDQTAL